MATATDKPLSLRLKIWLGIGFGAFVFLGCVAIVVSIFVFDKFFPFDEKRQNEIAQSIVKIEKLPPGFERTMAAKMGDTFVVEYRNEPTTLDIKLFRTGGGPTEVPGDQLLAQSTAIFTDSPIEKKVVCNEDLFFRIQDQKMMSSSKLLGFIVPKATKQPIHIESVSSGAPYKMEEMDKFLSSIKGF